VTSKVTLAISNSHTLGNVAHINNDIFTHESETLTWRITPTVLPKLKNFLRLRAVIYTVKVVISQMRCKIVTLLLQTTH